MPTIGFFRKRIRLLQKTCYIVLLLFLVIYLLVPLCFHSSERLQRHFVFVNDVPVPKSINFSRPESQGLLGAINRYIKTDEVTLGVWQILPIDLISLMPKDNSFRDQWFLDQLSDGKPVILYCHGNTPSRATFHRILLYEVLQALNYHVISFDYRGYADSSNIIPTENGVVNDTLNVVQWIKLHTDAPIFVWGHSLGTGISTKAVSILCRKNMCPQAIVLQSPFTSIADELRASYVTAPYRILPCFDYVFIKPLAEEGIFFNSEQNIMSVKCPIMILHAKDDIVVPYILGEKLYNSAMKHRNKSYGMLTFVPYDAYLGYGHNYISRSPLLPDIITEFMNKALQFNANDVE